MEHGRLPWPTPDELDGSARAVYEKIVGGPRSAGPPAFRLTDSDGRLEGPFNAMLVNPVVGDALQELGAAIRYGSSLSAREREIAILLVARLRASEFEWYAHERVGRLAGLSDAEIASLLDGRAPTTSTASTFEADELTLIAVARGLLEHRDLDDVRFADAEASLGRVKLADLIVLVGYYDLLALSLRTWRTPLPSGEAVHF